MLNGKATTMETLTGNLSVCDTLTVTAYGIAVKNGFKGTEKEWLESLKGEKGDMGDNGSFCAEYEVTPIEDIVDAHNAGKAIVCKHGGLLLPLVQRDRNIATFSGIYNGNLHVIVNNDGEWRWTTDSYVKVVEVRNVDHDDTIPTERAVWQKIFEREEALTNAMPLIANRVSAPGYKFDKTYAEIREAVAAGRTVLLNNNNVMYALSASGPRYYQFMPFVTANTDVSKPGLRVNSSDVWSEVATGVEPMTEDKVKELIQENATEGITEAEVNELIDEKQLTTPLYVKLSSRPEGISADKTFAEIHAAHEAGRMVLAKLFDKIWFSRACNSANVYFSLIYTSGTTENSLLRLSSSNTWILQDADFPLGILPTTTEITEASTDERIPTAKAVFDYVKNNAGGASEWSDLGESVTNLGDTLTWDGNTEGKVTDNFGIYVKISDNVPTKEDAASGWTEAVTNVESGEVQTMSTSGEEVAVLFNESGAALGNAIAIIPSANMEYEGMVWPEAGIYAISSPGGYVSSFTIPGYNFTESTIKPVPEKYLPMDAIMAEIESRYTNVAEVGM